MATSFTPLKYRDRGRQLVATFSSVFRSLDSAKPAFAAIRRKYRGVQRIIRHG